MKMEIDNDEEYGDIVKGSGGYKKPLYLAIVIAIIIIVAFLFPIDDEEQAEQQVLQDRKITPDSEVAPFDSIFIIFLFFFIQIRIFLFNLWNICN